MKALAVVCMAAAVACGGEERVAEQPAYAAAAYAVAEPDDAVTELRLAHVTREAGIDFVHQNGAFGEKWMPETMGSGGGFLDYDGDGWLDILLVNGAQWPGNSDRTVPSTPRLYRNLGDGTFRDATAHAGLTFSIYGMGATIADYDADGDVDVYLTAVGDNMLLRNDGGSFVDVTDEAGVHGNSGDGGTPPAWSTAAAWLDFDRDGRVDLFVCNYVRWSPATDLFMTLDGKSKSYATPEQYEGDSCRLYRNRHGSRFTDVTSESGVFNPDGKSLGVAVADFNGDSWPDLVVANDTERNFLYINDRDGTFTDAAVGAGMGYDESGRARAGMGIDVGDIRGSGNLSIAIGNFSQEPLSLYTQVGTGLFQDLAGRAGLTRRSLLQLTFGVAFVDLDLDGLPDLVTANGHIEPEINNVQQSVKFAQSPQVFLNSGDGRFRDASDELGTEFNEPVVARGVAYGDIDRDGDPDLLITVNGGPPRLFRNDLPTATAYSLALQLRGRAPNLEALGAVVTVFSGDRVQRRMVRTGSSYLSHSDHWTLLFGLGDRTAVDSIAVRWPTSGEVSRFGPASAGKRYSITEGSSRMLESGDLRRAH
jgi:hypothetical protein